MFIQTEETPNPATIKFIPGRPVMTQGTANFPTRETALQTPLAEKLFQHPAVHSVFLGSDFISITKTNETEWLTIKPALLTSIMEFFLNNTVIEVNDVKNTNNLKSHNSSPEDLEIIKEIEELIETRIRPAVAQDGGDIIFDHYDDGIVYVQLQGACSSCPSSTATLKSGIENMLRHYIPEIVEVRSL